MALGGRVSAGDDDAILTECGQIAPGALRPPVRPRVRDFGPGRAKQRIGHREFPAPFRLRQILQRSGRFLREFRVHEKNSSPRREARPIPLRVTKFRGDLIRRGRSIGRQHAFVLQHQGPYHLRTPEHIGLRMRGLADETVDQSHGFGGLRTIQRLNPDSGFPFETIQNRLRMRTIQRGVDHNFTD
jgi:hypothetical protein